MILCIDEGVFHAICLSVPLSVSHCSECTATMFHFCSWVVGGSISWTGRNLNAVGMFMVHRSGNLWPIFHCVALCYCWYGVLLGYTEIGISCITYHLKNNLWTLNLLTHLFHSLCTLKVQEGGKDEGVRCFLIHYKSLQIVAELWTSDLMHHLSCFSILKPECGGQGHNLFSPLQSLSLSVCSLIKLDLPLHSQPLALSFF